MSGGTKERLHICFIVAFSPHSCGDTSRSLGAADAVFEAIFFIFIFIIFSLSRQYICADTWIRDGDSPGLKSERCVVVVNKEKCT